MTIFKAKIVGLKFHRISTEIKDGDEVFVMATENEYDSDALGLYTMDENEELVGFVANSSLTLSKNNKKNGCKNSRIHSIFSWITIYRH